MMAPPLAEAALKFGPPEYFSLTVLGLLLATYLTGDSPLKGPDHGDPRTDSGIASASILCPARFASISGWPTCRATSIS